MSRGRTKVTQYVVYRGEKFVDIGKADELAERLGKKMRYIYWMSCCKRYKNGKHRPKSFEVFRVEEDEEDV